MTKSELMENYTMEQLVEMVVELKRKNKNIEQVYITVHGMTKTYPIEEVSEIVRAYEDLKLCKEQNKECKTILPTEYLKVLTLNQELKEKQMEINKLKNVSEVKNDEIQKLKWIISNLEESNGRLQAKVDTYNNYLLPRATKKAKELLDRNQFVKIRIVAIHPEFIACDSEERNGTGRKYRCGR